MFSPRYAWPVLLALVIAIVPTTIHTYIGLHGDIDKSVSSIPETLAGYVSSPTTRNSRWGKDIFDSDDWFERTYINDRGEQIRLFAAHSYNHKRLYHHPEIAQSRGTEFTVKQVAFLDNDENRVVHVLKNREKGELAAYVLIENNRLIEKPILNQMRGALAQMVSPKSRMLLVYAAESGVNDSVEFAATNTARLLSASVNKYLDDK